MALDKPGEPSAAGSEGSIPLYVVDGVATVWDAQTAATLHCQHDISGLRVGTLPGVVQQNAFLGLPITLMPEETAHLVNSGVAHLVPVPSTLSPPSPAVVAARTAARVSRSRALAERLRGEEDARALAAKAKYAPASDAVRAKRVARARKRAEAARDAAIRDGGDPEAAAAACAAAIAEAENAGASTSTKPVKEAKAEAPVFTAENTNLFTVVHGAPDDEALPRGTAALGSDTLPFPRTVRDVALAQTFDALHARGLRMGLGPRFGGEYLIYPGDYLRYHAHFTSQVIVRDNPILPAELVAWGRLGTGTKKAGLLCCWDDGKRGDEDADMGEVEFYSLEWASFG